MKRLWIGVFFLVALLLLTVAGSLAMDAIHDPISNQLREAADAAQAQDWARADALMQQAHGRWSRYWALTASFADHNPMDDIDALFAELEVFRAQRETVHFAAICAHLSELARAMEESHNLSWWNLL